MQFAETVVAVVLCHSVCCVEAFFFVDKNGGRVKFPFFTPKKISGTTGAYSYWQSSTSNVVVVVVVVAGYYK